MYVCMYVCKYVHLHPRVIQGLMWSRQYWNTSVKPKSKKTLSVKNLHFNREG